MESYRNPLDNFDRERALLLGGDAHEPLIEHSGEQDTKHGVERRSNLRHTVFNFCNTVIGAGIMALPYQMAKLGIVLGTFYNVMLAFLMYLSSAAVLRGVDRFGEWTFTDVARKNLGKHMGVISQWSIVMQGFGALAVYLIIIGDVMVGKPGFEGIVPITAKMLGATELHTWYYSRSFVVLVVCVICLLPMVTRKSLTGLAHTSALAIGLASCFALLTVLLALHAVVNGRIADVNLAPDKRLIGTHPLLLVLELFGAIATMSPAYCGHMNLPPLAAELKGYSYSRIKLATQYSMCICSALYIAVSICCYIVFGGATQPDILSNFSATSLAHLMDDNSAKIVGFVVSLFYAAKLVFIFPMVNWATRENISDFVFGTSRPTGRRFYTVTVSILGGVYLLSMVVASIEIALTIIGCFAGVSLAWMVPGLMVAMYEKGEKSSGLLAVVLIVGGVVVFIAGMTQFVLGYVHP